MPSTSPPSLEPNASSACAMALSSDLCAKAGEPPEMATSGAAAIPIIVVKRDMRLCSHCERRLTSRIGRGDPVHMAHSLFDPPPPEGLPELLAAAEEGSLRAAAPRMGLPPDAG